jgi:lysozyme
MNRNFLWLGIAIMTASVFIIRRVSGRGLDHLKKMEAFRARPYLDEARYPTIGWGHKIKPGEQFTQISMEEGELLLREDLREAEQAVNQYVKVPLNQNQFDALTSFVFNVGIAAFKNSTLLNKLNTYDYFGALAELSRWDKVTVNGEKVVSDGLRLRRAREQELFLS